MIGDVAIGRCLRRFRQLHGIKQAHMAELLDVSQGSVSRWESGTHAPDRIVQARIESLIATRCDSRGDAALRRLVTTSRLNVHLVCDATHRLLAVSARRAASWRTDAGPYIGQSLWRFASPEIVTAEDGLPDRGWLDHPFQSFRFHTGPNHNRQIVIEPGIMEWESILLSDGRVGRLATTIDPPA